MKTKEVAMNNTSEARDEAGCTNWFTRFFSKPATELTGTAQPTQPAQKTSAHQPMVLVVDDDPLFLKLATSRLETEGYHVITAKDGSEAIEAARKQKPNVVILDVNLPQDFGVAWDGFRLIEWLLRCDHLKGIPVVMITSGDPSKTAREAIRAGARAFYHKRMDQTHLISMVKQCLGTRQPAETMSKGDERISQI